MIEAIVEAGGLTAALALLLYFQVIRPGRPAPARDVRQGTDPGPAAPRRAPDPPDK